MPRIDVSPRAVFAMTAVALLGSGPAAARAGSSASGGASAPSRPAISAVSCGISRPVGCAPGDTLTLKGEGLDDARAVTFLGRRGRADDRRVRPRSRSAHALTVSVPPRAHSGRVRVTSARAGSSRAAGPVIVRRSADPSPDAPPGEATSALYAGGPPAVFRYRAPAAAAGLAAVEAFRVADGAVVASWPVQPGPDGSAEVRWDGRANGVAVAVGRYAFRVTGQAQASVMRAASGPPEFDVFDAIFPIRGKHDLGQAPTNDFGGARGHMGQDMFAACGTRLVAARGGTVASAAYQERAGNYVVISGPDGQSYVYLHMRKPSPLVKGQPVLTGQPVGEVGETGRASGCHLHFEMWSAPGRYAGGKAFDPLPELTRWDAFS